MLMLDYVPLETYRMDGENLVEVGQITHYFAKISVAVVDLTSRIEVGDTIVIKGPTTDSTQLVESMQIEHESVKEAKAGQSVGLKVDQRVKEKDIVYKKLS